MGHPVHIPLTCSDSCISSTHQVSPNELAARASPTAPRRSDLPKLDTNLMAMQNQVRNRFLTELSFRRPMTGFT